MELNSFENVKQFVEKLVIDNIIKVKEKQHFERALRDSYEDFLIND